MAIVVPNKLVVLESTPDAMRAVRRAEFLQDEDASSDITSALDGLIGNALAGRLGVETMSNVEQSAFTFLSFASENRQRRPRRHQQDVGGAPSTRAALCWALAVPPNPRHPALFRGLKSLLNHPPCFLHCAMPTLCRRRLSGWRRSNVRVCSSTAS
jgi:hypothetical protein